MSVRFILSCMYGPLSPCQQWLKLAPEDVKEQIYKLAKKGLTPSQIGEYQMRPVFCQSILNGGLSSAVQV